MLHNSGLRYQRSSLDTVYGWCNTIAPLDRRANRQSRGLCDQAVKKIRRSRMANSRSSDSEQIIEVTFNQQQYVVIERLKTEGQFGRTDEEIVRNIFLEFLRQEGV